MDPTLIMAYTDTDYKTKKALREAVTRGDHVTVYQPNTLGPQSPVPTNGTASVEGPHYPEPHRWYANVTLKDGLITEVK